MAIPVRNHLAEFTAPLLQHLRTKERCDLIWVYDNGSTDETAAHVGDIVKSDDRVSLQTVPDMTLAGMWNDAIRRACALEGEPSLALCNNDITLPPRAIGTLVAALRADPALWAVSPNPDRRVADGIAELGVMQVGGSYRLGGLTGWCFALATEHFAGVAQPVDEQYEWWYGEDHLFASITARGGRLARVLGVGCDHVNEGTASDGNHEWTHEAKARDHARYRASWPGLP